MSAERKVSGSLALFFYLHFSLMDKSKRNAERRILKYNFPRFTQRDNLQESRHIFIVSHNLCILRAEYVANGEVCSRYG
jgi:hypothetical protein